MAEKTMTQAEREARAQKLYRAMVNSTKNPDSDITRELVKRVNAGNFDAELEILGMRRTKPDSKLEKVAKRIGRGAKKFGKALIQSEKRFGESIAGAIQPSTGSQRAVEDARESSNQMQQKLIETIQRKRELGEDTTRLTKALKDFTGQPLPSDEELNPALLKTNKQVIGEAVGVAADIIGAGALPGVAGKVAKPAVGGTLRGLASGATRGALSGAAFGAVEGGARAAQEQKNITEGAVTGGVVGGVAGGVIGGVTGAVGGFLQKRKELRELLDEPSKKIVDRVSKDKKLRTALEVVDPALNKKEKIAALARSGRPGGATQSTELGKFDVLPDRRLLETAEAAKDIVSKNKSPVANIVALNDEISDISENTVTPFLRDNPSPFNMATIEKRLDDIDLPNVVKADKTLERQYRLTVESMLDEIKKNPKNMEGLWDSRKSFDGILQKELAAAGNDINKMTLAQRAVTDTRRTINDFIAENTPDEVFRDGMAQLTSLYDARSNIATKNFKLIDKNMIQRFIARNPVKGKLLKNIAGATILGVVGKELFID